LLTLKSQLYRCHNDRAASFLCW